MSIKTARFGENTVGGFGIHIYHCFCFYMVILFSVIAEHAESELADFKAWLDYLSHKSSDPKVCSITVSLI